MEFKIPYTGIKISSIKNIATPDLSPKTAPTIDKRGYRELMDEVFKMQIFQIRRDIDDWINSINLAESPLLPDRVELMRVYKDITLDAHLSGIIGLVKNAIKAKKFQFVKADGSINEETTKYFQDEWFYDHLDNAIDAFFYGYSLEQFGEIKDKKFSKITLIPREYVTPDWEIVKHSLYAVSKDAGMKYNEKPYSDWTLFINGNTGLGLLNKVAPHCIGKKNVMLSWWQFAELFGIPQRVLKTDIRDDVRRKRGEAMMQNMGSASWAVIDKEDEYSPVMMGQTDAYRVFSDAINLHNKEISKALAGQTGVFDENSFVGTAEVHERMFGLMISSFQRKIKFLNNGLLKEKMINLKLPFPKDEEFTWEAEEIISIEQKVKLIDTLEKGYEITDMGFLADYLGLNTDSLRIKAAAPSPFSAPADKWQSNLKAITDHYSKKGCGCKTIIDKTE